MKPPKRTLPSVLHDAAPAPISTPSAPAKAVSPRKGPQHSFFIDEDLEKPLRRGMYHKGINPETGKRYTKQDIFNMAMRQLSASDADLQRPIPGE